MNIDKEHTKLELKEILAQASCLVDNILWVDIDGEVHLTPIPLGKTAAWVSPQLKMAMFRLPILAHEENKIGSKIDDSTLDALYVQLCECWQGRGWSA